VYTILKSMVSRKTRLKFHYLISCSTLYLIVLYQSFLLHRMNFSLHFAMLLYASVVF